MSPELPWRHFSSPPSTFHPLLPPSPRRCLRLHPRGRCRCRCPPPRSHEAASSPQRRSPKSHLVFPYNLLGSRAFFPLLHFRISSLHPAARRDSTVATLCIPFVPFTLRHPLLFFPSSILCDVSLFLPVSASATATAPPSLPLCLYLYLFLLVPAMNPLSS